MKKVLAVLILAVFFTSTLIAQDRFFSRTYTSNVLPKYGIDIEFWHTSRMGHAGQFYHAQDQRMEIEYGLGKNVQTALYFNRFQKRYSQSDNGTEVSNEIGISNEWKWKLADPSVDKIGFALYGEWELKGGDEIELETKLIFDKYIGNHLLAFNAIFEFEKEFGWEEGKTIVEEVKYPVEFDFGYQYLLNPNWGLGFEIRNNNTITKEMGWENSVLYAGPTVNFREKKWFIILNYLPQLTNLKRTLYYPDKNVFNDMEKTEARIIMGISF